MNPSSHTDNDAKRATPHAKLERVEGLSPQEFLEHYVIPRKPAILLDAIDGWPALRKWGAEFWKEHYGARSVTVDGTPYPLKQIIDLALDSTPDHPAPYYRNIKLRNEYPELMDDLLPSPPLCGPNWFHGTAFLPIRNHIVGGGGHYELFIGGAGRAFPFLHFDSPGAHTFIHQIVGRKKFILFAPEDGPFLYPGTEKSFSVSRIKDVEDTESEAFPLYRNATRYEDEAGPGETLFMPSGWWHTARMLSFSVSLGIDVANHTNWADVVQYMRRRARYENKFLALTYMTAIRMAGFATRLTGGR